MNQDEIIKMARQAGIAIRSNWAEQELKAFAKLVAAKESEFWMEQGKVDVEEAIRDEREACAMVCEGLALYGGSESRQLQRATLKDCAFAIRSRGEA